MTIWLIKKLNRRESRIEDKKSSIVSDKTQLEFGPLKPVLVSGSQGLNARGVGKSFNKRRVVRNVSIQLNRGEAVGLLGPNGAGKTTTFYMLAGLIPADEGSVYIDGENVTGLPIFQRARLGMGYLPQESSIFRGLTVEQNIRAVLETLDESDDERAATLDELILGGLLDGLEHLLRQLLVRERVGNW